MGYLILVCTRRLQETQSLHHCGMSQNMSSPFHIFIRIFNFNQTKLKIRPCNCLLPLPFMRKQQCLSKSHTSNPHKVNVPFFGVVIRSCYKLSTIWLQQSQFRISHSITKIVNIVITGKGFHKQISISCVVYFRVLRCFSLLQQCPCHWQYLSSTLKMW